MTFKKLRRGQPAVPFPLACAVCSLLDGVLVPCSLLCPGIPFLCSIFGSVAPVLVLARRLTLSRRGAASCMSACRSSIPLAHPTDEPPMPLHQRNRPAMPPSPQPHTHTHNRTHNHNHKKKYNCNNNTRSNKKNPFRPHLPGRSATLPPDPSPLQKTPPPFQRRPLPLLKKIPPP